MYLFPPNMLISTYRHHSEFLKNWNIHMHFNIGVIDNMNPDWQVNCFGKWDMSFHTPHPTPHPPHPEVPINLLLLKECLKGITRTKSIHDSGLTFRWIFHFKKFAAIFWMAAMYVLQKLMEMVGFQLQKIHEIFILKSYLNGKSL